MTELTSLRNIGKEMARKLNAVGISSAEELREIGAKQAFLKLKTAYPKSCSVFLYTLEGAVQGVDFDKLAPETKLELREFCEAIKNNKKA